MADLVLLLPTYALNLAVVYGMITVFRFQTVWILSAVTIGDIVAWEINVNFGIYVQTHWKWLQRLQNESKEFLRK